MLLLVNFLFMFTVQEKEKSISWREQSTSYMQSLELLMDIVTLYHCHADEVCTRDDDFSQMSGNVNRPT